MPKDNMDYNRLIYLTDRIKSKAASKSETDEYMRILYQNGNISQQQYNNYTTAGVLDTDEILKAAMIIGGIILVTYLLSSIFKW